MQACPQAENVYNSLFCYVLYSPLALFSVTYQPVSAIRAHYKVVIVTVD